MIILLNFFRRLVRRLARSMITTMAGSNDVAFLSPSPAELMVGAGDVLITLTPARGEGSSSK